MSKQSVFSIFSINELLASPRLKPIIERLHPAAVVATVKGVYEDVTREMLSAASERRVPEIADLTEKILARLQDIEKKGNRLEIDGGGVIFRRNRLLAPLGRRTLDEMLWRLDVPVLEFPDESLDRAEAEPLDRLAPTPASVAKTLCARTGAEDALFFASCDLAEIALFQIFGKNGPILTARRDMTEDSSGRRIADLMAFSPAPVIEVGASNGVRGDDFFAFTQQELGLIRLAAGVSSGLKPPLSVEQMRQLAESTRPWNAPILLRVDFAPLLDLSDIFLDPVPAIGEWLETGPDLLLFGGGQLLGGPDCGILLGRRRFLDILRRSKTTGLFLPHRADLAGLSKALELQRGRDEAEREIPIIRLICSQRANLLNRAERLAPQLRAAAALESVEIRDAFARLTPAPDVGRLGSVVLALRPRKRSAAELSALLANGSPAVLAPVEGDEVTLNLKTILPQHDALIAQAVESMA